MLIKLLKLPFKLIALPLIPALMILNLAFALVVGLSSIVTNLLSTFFLMGAVAGWITHSAPSMIWQAVGIGVFFMLAPTSPAGSLPGSQILPFCSWSL